jgi:formylglycine-generating enzyme required for sulfatase activity
MSRRATPFLILVASLPLVAVVAEDNAPVKSAEPAAPVPAKLDRASFTEKAGGWKTEVLDPDADPPKTRKVDLAAKFDMVWVPGGEFTMGSPDAEPGRDAIEGPRHKVDPKKKLGADAVTRPTNAFVDATYGHERDGHPALCMTHHAAMMFCAWLRKKTGRPYRLPTEAEWEYAARGGKGDAAYFFGDDPKKLDDYAWFKDNSPDEDHARGTTHKVGTKKPNPFGLYDLYGNVWEWTLDQYDPDAYARRAKDPLSLRPVTPPTDKKWAHVVRGGSWADKADRCRSAARRVSEKSWMKWDPQEPQSIWWLTRMDVIGFRVVLAEEEQPELVGLHPKVVKKSE